MKTIITSLALLGLLAAGVEARTWTNKTGTIRVEADFHHAANGTVFLQTPDGNLKQVPLNKLSAADQEFVRSGRAAETATPMILGKQPTPTPKEAPDTEALKKIAPERFTKAIERNPNDPKAYYARGLVLTNRKKYKEALSDFNQAIELDPQFAPAFDGRGVIYSKMRNAVQAHADFSKAIELNPELSAAYKHRGENRAAYAKTPEGKIKLRQELENFRKKYHAVAASNRRHTPWQPLNNTTGNMGRGSVSTLIAYDLKRAKELEVHRPVLHNPGHHQGGVSHGGVHYGGVSYGGVHYGGKGVEGPAPPVPARPLVSDPPLQVLPGKVYKGDTMTLVANPTSLAKGLATPVGPDQPFPKDADAIYGPEAKLPPGTKVPEAKDIQRVDFYRDVDKDNKLDPKVDEFLGFDADAKDGYTKEIPTDSIPPGNQTFFAVPRGAPLPPSQGSGQGQDGQGKSPSQNMLDMVEMLERAATSEDELAKKAASATKGEGMAADDANALSKEQELVADVMKEVLESVGEKDPLPAAVLKSANDSVNAAAKQLEAIQASPGESSKGQAGEMESQAKDAAGRLREAADMLRDSAKQAEAEEKEKKSNPETSGDQMAQGAPAAGQGEIMMAAADPNKGKLGDGKGDGGGDGHGHHHGDDCDCDECHRFHDEYVDDDRAEDLLDRADDYIEEDQYDEAIDEYDRLVEDYPNNPYYLRRRASVQLLRGGYQHAIRDYNQLAPSYRGGGDLYYNRGCAYLAQGKLANALADFNKSLAVKELPTSRYLIYNNRGTTYAKNGEYAKALADFNEAVRINPADALAYRNRALAYKKLGKLTEAEADFTKYQKLGGK